MKLKKFIIVSSLIFGIVLLTVYTLLMCSVFLTFMLLLY